MEKKIIVIVKACYNLLQLIVQDFYKIVLLLQFSISIHLNNIINLINKMLVQEDIYHSSFKPLTLLAPVFLQYENKKRC